MALGLLALILAGLLYRWRLRQLTLRGRELSQQVAERTEQLRVANEDLRKYSEQLKTASMTDPPHRPLESSLSGHPAVV